MDSERKSNGSSDPKVIVMEEKNETFFCSEEWKNTRMYIMALFSFMCASIEIMCNNRAMYHVLLMNSE
jgi:hypothetical protein